MTAVAYTALASFGSSLTTTNPIGYVGAYSLIGVKGMNPGTGNQEKVDVHDPNFARSLVSECF